MANLAAVDLAKMMSWASIKVYTVGAPRAGNHAFAKEYNQLIPDSFAIINYRVSLVLCSVVAPFCRCPSCQSSMLCLGHWHCLPLSVCLCLCYVLVALAIVLFSRSLTKTMCMRTCRTQYLRWPSSSGFMPGLERRCCCCLMGTWWSAPLL